MIVFVEGVDGSGKSTLIENLSNMFSSLRVSKQDDEHFTWNKVVLLGKSLGNNAVILVDRSPLTEYVYRTENGKPCKYKYSQILKWLKEGKVIYCNNDNAYNNAMSRGEDNLTDKNRHDKVKHIYDTYISTLRLECVPTMYYNWQENCLDDVIKFIEEV